MARIDKMDDVTQNDELEGVLDEIERSIADHRRGFVPYVIPSEVFLQYPSSDVVKPASTPRPPKLSGVFAQDFSLMKLAYHSAVRYRDRFLPDLARFRKRRNPMDGAWEKLKKSHALMISAGVDEPHSWCMFRLRMLAKSRAENKPRSLSIFGVYSKKALTDPKILEMYHDEKDRLCARRDVATHSLAELVSLWNKAREAVIEARPATRDEAVHVARRVLSLGTYNRLVDAAKREQVAYRSEMRRRASAGEWIWATLG